MRILARLLAIGVGVVVVAVVAVVATDAWRDSGRRPVECTSVVLEPARGDLHADDGVVAAAWAALADPGSSSAGELSGSRPVLDRSCLLYAGRLGGDRSTVTFLETTRTDDTVLLRIAEVLLDGDRTRRAVTGYPTSVGNEVAAGLVLPLSGLYLAPPDVTGVQVARGSGEPPSAAPSVAEGLFDLGAVPDRSRAEAEQGADLPVTVVLSRSRAGEPELVALPVVARPGSAPVREPLAVTVDGRSPVDPAVQSAVLAILPVAYADARLPAIVERAPGGASLVVRTATLIGGRGVTVEAGGAEPEPGLPVLRYFVPDVGPVVAAAQ